MYRSSRVRYQTVPGLPDCGPQIISWCRGTITSASSHARLLRSLSVSLVPSSVSGPKARAAVSPSLVRVVRRVLDLFSRNACDDFSTALGSPISQVLNRFSRKACEVFSIAFGSPISHHRVVVPLAAISSSTCRGCKKRPPSAWMAATIAFDTACFSNFFTLL